MEQADLAAAKELFGDAASTNPLDTFLPKTVKDFDDFAQMITNRYVLPHKDSKNYKVCVSGGERGGERLVRGWTRGTWAWRKGVKTKLQARQEGREASGRGG